MNTLAYIICPECGRRIGGDVDSSAIAGIIVLAVFGAAMIVSKILTGRWFP